MKRFIIFASIIVFTLSSFSQYCFRNFEGSNFMVSGSYQKVQVMKTDNSGAIWFNLESALNGIGANGLACIKDGNWSVFSSSNSDLPGNDITAVAFDSKGMIWVATTVGLASFNGTATTGWKVYTTAQGMPENNVTAMAIDENDNIWLGYSSGKLYKLTGETFTSIGEVANQIVNTIFIDNEDNVWLGLNATASGKKGIVKYDGSQLTQQNISESVTSLVQDSKGTIWACSATGVYTLNGNIWTKSFSLMSFGNLVIDLNDRLWMSTSDTLYSIQNGELRKLNIQNSGIPVEGTATFSRALAIDNSETIWYGYYKSSNAALGYLNFSELPVNLISEHELLFCLGSSVTADAGDGYLSYLWSSGETTRTINSSEDMVYNVVVKDTQNCFIYDTVHTVMQNPYANEKLCLVTVDDETNKNAIIWARTVNEGTASYNLYKETNQANQYKLLTNVPFLELSVYVDTLSVPETRSERYKISCIDSCGNESEMSASHKTMHLTINQGIDGRFNLVWENYEGFNFYSYAIYRGSATDNMEVIDTVPNNITTYTDNPVNGTYYYKIAVVLPQLCVPASLLKAGAGPFSEAVSNIEKRIRSTGSNNVVVNAPGLKVFPNTVKDKLYIRTFGKSFGKARIDLINVSGTIACQLHINEISGIKMIQIPRLSTGLYFLRIAGDNYYYREKIIIE